jgi:hypothetical protein
MLFSQAMRETVKAENPDVSFGTIGKILGQKWKELSDADKEVRSRIAPPAYIHAVRSTDPLFLSSLPRSPTTRPPSSASSQLCPPSSLPLAC